MTDETPTPSVERSVVLDADVETVLGALHDPDLLGAWLGAWRTDGTTESVTTDDGVRRAVERLTTTTEHDVAWRWHPADDDGAASIVHFTVTDVGGATRLTVVERPDVPVATSCGTPAGAPGVPWLGCLMALGAVLALGAPVPV